jgi:homoserine kinase
VKVMTLLLRGPYNFSFRKPFMNAHPVIPHLSLHQATAFAPATVANVGSAFDVMGFALDKPGDTVTARRAPHNEVRIIEIDGDNGRLSRESSKNTASVAISHLFSICNLREGVDLIVKKGMPLGSGLGSSAASAAAALTAVNELLQLSLSPLELLPSAIEAERVACSSGHADNVAPSLLGGFSLISSYTPLAVISLTCPAELWCVVVTPSIEIQTRDSRGVVPRHYPLSTIVNQLGTLGSLVAGITQGDYSLISRGLKDYIVVPARRDLIPGFQEVELAACQAGALGCSISGSGPTLFSLCKTREIAVEVERAMSDTFFRRSLHSQSVVSRINSRGALITDSQ